DKAAATVTVNGYSGAFDNQPHGATGSATGVNGEDLSSLLNLGASFTSVPGGTAHWTFAGNANYNSSEGDAAIVINLAQATVTVSFENGPYTYRGTAFTATARAMVDGVEHSLDVTYSGDCVNVSSTGCTASASFNDANHATAFDSRSITIAKA